MIEGRTGTVKAATVAKTGARDGAGARTETCAKRGGCTLIVVWVRDGDGDMDRDQDGDGIGVSIVFQDDGG